MGQPIVSLAVEVAAFAVFAALMPKLSIAARRGNSARGNLRIETLKSRFQHVGTSICK